MGHIPDEKQKNGKAQAVVVRLSPPSPPLSLVPENNREIVAADISTTSSVAPDGGWGWVVVFACFMVHLLTDGVVYSYGFFQKEYVRQFEVTQHAASWVASLLVGTTFCAGPLSSYLIKKLGWTATTIVGTLLAAGCLFATAYARSLALVYVTGGVGTGLGFGLIYLTAIDSVSKYFDKNRTLATGIGVCGSGFGTVVYGPLIGYLLVCFGDYRWVMLVLSGIILVCIVLAFVFKPLKQLPPTTTTNNKPLQEGDVKKEDKSKLKLALLRDPVLLIYMFSNFFTNVGYNVPYVFMEKLAEQHGMSQASTLLIVIGVANVVGRAGIGWGANKPWVDRLLVYNSCLLVCGIATALSPFCANFPLMAIYAAVFGFTTGGFVTLTSVCLADLVERDRFTDSLGLVLAALGAGSFAGLPFAGFLIDHFVVADVAFHVAGVTLAISGSMLYVIPWLVRRRNGGSSSEAEINTVV
ncbi:monocarboxylate transporter 13-like [Trichogramma pretiosum]|uniref:monocarboxylate transporter 13-like n=1 Tax=Trichogramma pretiosum TaxID=7493 RepID=UPI0006C9A2A9|nr:monocarboxylate transporter 13-like [Trichogramma pretiosum]